MASLQDAFYRGQQIKYNVTEPNRFLPDSIKGSLGDTIVKNALDAVGVFDPYTDSTIKPFSVEGARSLFQGTPKDVAELAICRQYSGLQGLEQLIRDTQDNPNLPVRCGWRYKKTPGSVIPEVSQGALGMAKGPLDETNPLDEIGRGVEWLWDLKAAQKRILTDIAREGKTGEFLRISDSLGNGDFKGKLGYCTTTKKMIPVLPDGRPMFPNDPQNTCPPSNLVTDPSRVPPPSMNNALANFQQVAFRELANCADTKVNPSLSRDCLLQAIKNNGCSIDGTLYTSLQGVDPNQPKWDAGLKSQLSFQAYQSKQGDNGFTDKLFQRGMSDWNMAIREIGRLKAAAQSSGDPYIRTSAKDLCTNRGAFDTYNFCAEIADGAPIQTVELSCLQRFWQEQNGKPAGQLYPRTKRLDPQLGTINTYGDYKAAVNKLVTMTRSTDPVVQRKAVNNLMGVKVNAVPFTPKNISQTEPDMTAPCYGFGTASPDRSIRLYTKSECDELGGRHFSNGECLVRTGGSFSWNCRYLNGQEDTSLKFWVDAMDASTLTIDGKNGIREWKDKSGQNRNMIQNASFQRPTYTKAGIYGGIEFSGNNQFLEIPNPNPMIQGQFTIFVVEQRKRGGSNWILGGNPQMDYSRNMHIGYRDDTVATMAFWANDMDFFVPTYRGSNEMPRIWSLRFGPGGKRVFIDGADVRVRNNNTNDNLRSWNGAALGRALTNFYKGIVYELLIYDTALDDASIRKVEGYLAHKWGIPAALPNGHAFKNTPP